jgi:alpha-tubulin suppressor-like RCC1 family protein
MATSASSLRQPSSLPERLHWCRWLAWFAINVLGAIAATAAPTITKFPVSQTVAGGQNVTFTVEATGTAPLSYQWFRGATPIAGATADTYTITGAQASDAGIYAVAVTDATGTARTFSAFSRAFAIGASHSLFAKNDGTLWAAGFNSNGQLGDGTTISHQIPVAIATSVTAVATGDNHSLFLKSDGTLWAMGSNGNGELGDGTTTSRSTPVQIASGVTAIAAGSSHSLFLKADGTLWATGNNFSGQLGDGTTTSRSTPVQIASGVRAISARAFQSFFIKTDGTLWAAGRNSSGQLGDGTVNDRSTPVQVATSVSTVAAGYFHTLFVKADGSAWAMGRNFNGQLGDGTTTSRTSPVQIMSGVAAAAAGTIHSQFLKTDGSLWGTGSNTVGQLGDGTTASRLTPIQVATGVTAVAANNDNSFILKSDGSLWATGFNSSGQFGDGTFTSRLAFAPVLLPTDTPAMLVVNTPPVITAQSNSQTVAAGSPITLSVTVGGTPGFSYQWYRDGTPLLNGLGATFSIPSVGVTNTGTYTVTVTNLVGTATSQPITLDISLPIVASQTGVVGRDVGLQANTGGSGTISWQASSDAGQTWATLTDGAEYSGTTTNLLRVLSAPAQTTGRLYRYTVSDGAHTYTSGAATINMFTTPLAAPSGIVVDKSGNLFVTDAAASAVLKIAPNLKFTVIAGKMGAAGKNDGSGPDARFDEPTGFILADDGSIALTDASNSTIRVISPAGTVSTFAGRAGTPGADDGDNLSATFNVPTAITADITGTYVIADQMNHTIRTSTGGKVYTLAGRPGIPGFADGTGSGASFFMPSGLAVRRDPFSSISWTGGSNGYGTIFVSDQGNNTIRVITNSGQVGTYIGAPGQAGSANGSRTSARLFKPAGLAFDGDGNLYVADSGNHAIRKVTPAGQVSTYAGVPTVRGFMDGSAGQALFNEPEGLAFDSARNLYVTDTGNGVIRKITPAGAVSTLLVLGNVPVINTQPASQSVAPGGSVSFTVSASGEGPLTYQWRKDGQPIPNATTANFQISPAASSDAGAYTVLVTNNWGSTESAAATLTISSTPPPPANSGGSGAGSGNSGGGGGGAPSWEFLALLAVLSLMRRCFPTRRGIP